MDHFRKPRNVGEIPDADGIGTAGQHGCDTLTIYLRIRDDCITDISFQCQGCEAAIACASMTTELAKGKHLDAAAEITDETIADALGGLSAEKRHVSNLGAEALANAIWDHINRSVQAEWARRQKKDKPAST